jgi:sporulation protein YlmC with PRC-barrel domain
VERRYEQFLKQHGLGMLTIPSDSAIRDHFTSCILIEQKVSPPAIPHLSEQFRSEMNTKVFKFDVGKEELDLEKEWPAGPTFSVSGTWPFIFVSSDRDYSGTANIHSDRYYVVGCLAVFETEPKRLIDLPEVTTGFGVLEDISKFLPPNLTQSAASQIHFYIKSALPFGAPTRTSLEDLVQFNATAISMSDSVILNQTSALSAPRVPSWKPFPVAICGAGSQTAALKLHVVERVAFDIIEGERLAHTSVYGNIVCDCDLPGTPEITLPLQLNRQGVSSLSVHSGAKLSPESSSEDKSVKVSFIPLSSAFCLCNYNYPSLKFGSGSRGFPILASFRLFQVSPNQFRFSLSATLKFLLSQFYMKFDVSNDKNAICIPHSTHSSKTRVDIVDGSVVWTFKSPATFNPDGEDIEGVVETDAPPTTEIGTFATLHFRVNENHFSKIKIIKEGISIFPNATKANISITYELISSVDDCKVMNRACVGDHPTQLKPIVQFTDCVEIIDSK